jgi:A/G-specific adenine glycosylase
MRFNKELLSKFPVLLMRWNRFQNRRKMPWKGEKDPYKIWLSEIILQQTRVEQGLKYYEKFVSNFPNVQSLATAKDQKIYKLWEGLGYYTRCRNLILSARFIARELSGKFPSTFEDILALKGVGHYTAAAIASFAFDLPHAVVDGNVFRVFSRFFGIKTPIDSTKGKAVFTQLAIDLLDKKRPGVYNQALMDFGAIICKPKAPLCSGCIFTDHCFAFNNDLVEELPVKDKKLNSKNRWFNYLVIEHQHKIYLRKRIESDIWKDLHEFVLIETPKKTSLKQVLTSAERSGLLKRSSYNVLAASPVMSQQLSHQKIIGKFVKIRVTKKFAIPGYKLVSSKHLSRFAFPRLINVWREKE